MRRRRVKDERITENTLIRVAIDLLLAHQDQLQGATEEELRESVTSELPKCVSSGVTISATHRHPEVRSSQRSDFDRPQQTDAAAPTSSTAVSRDAGVRR